jgi:hypothetical protein
LDARGQNRVILTIITASPRAFQRCIGLGGVDKVLVRLEDYYSAETAVWQPVLPSRGPLLGLDFKMLLLFIATNYHLKLPWGSCEDYIYYFLTYYIGARQQAYMTTPTAGPDRSTHV